MGPSDHGMVRQDFRGDCRLLYTLLEMWGGERPTSPSGFHQVPRESQGGFSKQGALGMGRRYSLLFSYFFTFVFLSFLSFLHFFLSFPFLKKYIQYTSLSIKTKPQVLFCISRGLPSKINTREAGRWECGKRQTQEHGGQVSDLKIQEGLRRVGAGTSVCGARSETESPNFLLCLGLPPPVPKQIKKGEVQR